MKRLRQKTRPAAKAPRLRAPTRSELQDELTEVNRHRAAISQVLRAIANSPYDLQPTFDTIVDSATRLCRADTGSLRLYEEKGFRLVSYRARPHLLEKYSPPILVALNGFYAQLVASRSPVHVPDLAAHELYRPAADSHILATVDAGYRTILIAPLVKDEELFGALALGRTHVRPFTDKQIELVTDFAAQAAIALEITRRVRQYREVQVELAHANRVLTMGQLTASIAHELRQPLGAAAANGSASLNWLMRQPPEMEKAKRSVEQLIEDVNRASDVMDRIHSLVKKAAPRMDKLDINGATLEVINLIRIARIRLSFQTRTHSGRGL